MESISFVPGIIANIGPIPVTNSMLVSWLVVGFLVIISYMATKNTKLIPSKLQNLLELVIETIYNLTEELTHSKSKTDLFFPFIATFFLFIVAANWIGLFPGFGTIEINNVPLFRSVNSDLNVTLTLALISAIATHFFALKYLGLKEYLKRWFSLNPIFLFVGILELIGEFTKVVSLSLRLFGNIFAGEVVLSTISNILAFGVPLPFYLLEIIVGVVQAAVFMMLTLAFMVLLSEKHVGEEH